MSDAVRPTIAEDLAVLREEWGPFRTDVDLSLVEDSPFHENGAAPQLRTALRNSSPEVGTLRIVRVDDFADVDEPGAAALVGGSSESALIAQDSDVMMYGEGGAGKTTLSVDLAYHLAAGDDWLGVPIAEPKRVLVAENEGPRPHFRVKLRRKRDAWHGSPVEDRLLVVEAPWAVLTFDDETSRQVLADAIREHELDVVIIGPLTRIGMNEAGTLQHVRDFTGLLATVRQLAGRAVTFVVIHHQNRAGTVSGAWEGAVDTLLHVQAQGHGHTRVHVEKARWSSTHHKTTLHLLWTDGDGYTVGDKPGVTDDTLADRILEAVLANGGASWNKIDVNTVGNGGEKRKIRDRLLAGERIFDAGGKAGMKLWHADDPARPLDQQQLRPDLDAPEDAPASTTGASVVGGTASLRPDVRRDAGRRDAPGAPADLAGDAT